jgi:hypothetical protein
MVLNNLADLYRVQGCLDEAEPLFERALIIQDNVLGSEHPDVARTLENYAALLRETGRGIEAAKMQLGARGIPERYE